MLARKQFTSQMQSESLQCMTLESVQVGSHGQGSGMQVFPNMYNVPDFWMSTLSCVSHPHHDCDTPTALRSRQYFPWFRSSYSKSAVMHDRNVAKGPSHATATLWDESYIHVLLTCWVESSFVVKTINYAVHFFPSLCSERTITYYSDITWWELHIYFVHVPHIMLRRRGHILCSTHFPMFCF